MGPKWHSWWPKSRPRSWWKKSIGAILASREHKFRAPITLSRTWPLPRRKKIRSGLRWLWQKIQQHPMRSAAIVVGVLGIALILAIIGGYLFNWDWSGFNGGYSKVTDTPNGTNIEHPVRK